MAYKIDADACIGCAACVDECPVNAISDKDGKCEINPDECIECGACADVCPVDAPKEA
ncbi:MAG TPA: ferredoxin [Clostridiales bacterium]|nr:ferredoxin [Clostridiales bacterium]HCG36178.1 ferredoxin [Clostridiales bacterium]